MNSAEPIVKDIVSPVPKSEWDRIYKLDSNSLPTQSSEWANVIVCSTRSVNCSRLYRFVDGVEVVLPLFSSRFSLPQLRIQRSPPYAWGYGGVISTKPLAASHLKALLDDCSKLRGAAVHIRPNPLHAELWAEAASRTDWQRRKRSSHVLDLEGGFDKVWNSRFPSKTRTKIRKAEKLGVSVETGSSDTLISEFDSLFRLSISRWAERQNEFGWLAALRGRLRDSKQKFTKMAQLSEGLLCVSIARLEGKPVAGIMVLVGHNAHYTRGAMDQRCIGNTNASHLLQKVAIKDACLNMCKHYHMGETGSSSSLAQFKSGFGSVEVPYAEYYHERIPLMTLDRKLRAMVKKIIGFKDA